MTGILKDVSNVIIMIIDMLLLLVNVKKIIMMFLMFDKAVRGFISKPELNAIIAAEGTGSGTSAFLSQDRWDEMDWDKDETISFEEFVFAFYAWVDDDEEVENA